jgi:acetoacetyl-CoA synthetase
MNIRGIRIGPGEIYTVLRAFPEIAEALAVEQTVEGSRAARRRCGC